MRCIHMIIVFIQQYSGVYIVFIQQYNKCMVRARRAHGQAAERAPTRLSGPSRGGNPGTLGTKCGTKQVSTCIITYDPCAYLTSDDAASDDSTAIRYDNSCAGRGVSYYNDIKSTGIREGCARYIHILRSIMICGGLAV